MERAVCVCVQPWECRLESVASGKSVEGGRGSVRKADAAEAEELRVVCFVCVGVALRLAPRARRCGLGATDTAGTETC